MSTWGAAESLVLEAAAAAEVLVDPTTVAGKTVELKNNSNVAQTWTSTGATPFVVGGINTANLVLAVGQSARLYSNGTRWVVTGGPGSRAFFAGSGVTDAAGNITFTFPAGTFTVPPVVAAAFQGAASASPVDYRVTALTAVGCTINVRQSLATVVALIGLTILAASVPLAGATIHLMATAAGTTP